MYVNLYILKKVYIFFIQHVHNKTREIQELRGVS